MATEAPTSGNQETILQGEQPAPDVQQEDAPGGLNIGLLIIFGVILAAIAFSNVWLRKRAERAES